MKRAELKIPRFYGLDLKTNVVDVKDGFSLDCENVYQNAVGVVSKRPGASIMFAEDETGSLAIDEIGTCTLNGTKYYFKFVDGDFKWATSLTGSVLPSNVLSPSPAISTSNPIYWAVIDDKLFFVDGSNNLRYFNGTAISDSTIYARPTVALTTAGAGTGYDYTYTVDNGNGESPACATALTNEGSAETVTITGNTGPQTLVAGDVVRVYSKATTGGAFKLVKTYTWLAADVMAGTKNLATDAIAADDSQEQLYTEKGEVANKTAVTAMAGITVHYGRLVGWKGSTVYNSKKLNPHSWPDTSAKSESFVYQVSSGDGDTIKRCISFNESVYVLKNRKVEAYGGTGPRDDGSNAYSYRKLETNGIGCVGGKSAAVIGDEGKSYLVWLSQQGFVATTGYGYIRIGENVESQLLGLSESVYSGAVAFHHKREGLYVCFLGGNTSKTGWVLDVREDGGVKVGWFKWVDVNVKCAFYDEDRMLFGTPQGFCGAERISGTSVDFSDIKIEYIETSAVNTSTEEITVTESYQTGDQVVVRTNGTIPAGLTANTTYYVIRVSATKIKLATSLANAQAGTAINITSQGSGTHSIVGSKAIEAYYTTNWIRFGSASRVKKLMKPAVIMNAIASDVSLTMKSAYNWVYQFTDSQTITLGSDQEWGTGSWSSFTWGSGGDASVRNVAIARRKVRSIRYKWENSTINQDFNLQGLEQEFELLRNRGNAA